MKENLIVIEADGAVAAEEIVFMLFSQDVETKMIEDSFEVKLKVKSSWLEVRTIAELNEVKKDYSLFY